MKNFNHFVKEIIEKDLDLAVNVETVNTLRYEFLADLPSISGKPMPNLDNKENIDSVNRESIIQSKEVEENKVSKTKFKEAVVTPKNNYFRNHKSYNHNHQPKTYNNTKNRNSNYLKDRTTNQSNDLNGIPVFYYKKENFYRINGNTHSQSEIQWGNRNNFNDCPQEKIIYNSTSNN